MRVAIFSPSEAQKQDDTSIYVVIDTFRATTSLTTLKHSRARKIYIVSNKTQAFALKNQYYSQCLLVGEEGGLKIEGFDYGNTPSIFFDKDFKGKEVIFTSTSGAKVLLLLENKKQVYLASLVNLSAITKELIKQAKFHKKEIVIVPSGYFNDETIFIIEDWLTAVLLAEKITEDSSFNLHEKGDFWLKTDNILENKDIQTILLESKNGIGLKELGFEQDVNFAIQIDILNVFLKVKKFENFDKIKYVIVE